MGAKSELCILGEDGGIPHRAPPGPVWTTGGTTRHWFPSPPSVAQQP